MVYSIKELSKLAGVSARTLRYYDEIGLLEPLGTSDAGYRYYGKLEVDLLWQILFYRERGFGLKQIHKILYEKDFDLTGALAGQLLQLEKQKAYMEELIQNVKRTISSMKGESKMSDEEKFEVFKKRLVQENEGTYGKEVRKKYGDAQADDANRKMLNLSQEEWSRFKNLEQKIKEELEAGVRQGIKPESEAASEIVGLHKEWLTFTWKVYSPEAHRGVGDMYTADERFQGYYDESVTGCANLLGQAIAYWVK